MLHAKGTEHQNHFYSFSYHYWLLFNRGCFKRTMFHYFKLLDAQDYTRNIPIQIFRQIMITFSTWFSSLHTIDSSNDFKKNNA